MLVEALENDARAVHVERDALDSWDLERHLERLWKLDRPWREMKANGADVAARMALDLMSA